MKRFFSAALCAILFLSASACAKKEPGTHETEEPSTSLPTAENTLRPEEITPIPESEILYEIEAEVGTADSGPLSAVDGYEVYRISEKKDLDPFRAHLTGLTAEEEAKYLADENGALFVLEVTSASDYSYYGISSITQTGGNLVVVISSGEDEFKTPLHTFFLLYFPPEIYQGEALQVLFE